MKRYVSKFKEAIYMNGAGEQLLFTIDLSKVSKMKHFVDQLFDPDNEVEVNKRVTNLTDRKRAKIVIPYRSRNIAAFKSVLLMNNFDERDMDKIFKDVVVY